MKKYIYLSSIVVFLLVMAFSWQPALAAGPLSGALNRLDQTAKPTRLEGTLETNIGTVIKVILGTLGTIFLVLMIYAGFLWMTASGKEEQITKAQDTIKAAVIGLAIVLSAYAITSFVASRLGGGGGSSGSGKTSCASLQGVCRTVAELQDDPLICQNFLEQGACPNEGICCK